MSNLYTCTDCKLTYTLSNQRIKDEAPKHDSFICDICADEGEKTMSDGEIIDEMIKIIETDGELLTDEQVINEIAQLLMRKRKL